MFGLDFLRRREKFLLLEIAPKRTSGLLIAVDRDKNISAEKHWEDFPLEKLRGDYPRNLRKRQIIVSARPEIAATIVASVAAEREEADAGEPISPAELENFFSRALGQVFDRIRGEAGKRLGVNELDAALVGARADSFRVDGHLVLNPVGFRGGTLEAVFDFIFVTRDIFEDLGNVFKANEGIFFTNFQRAALFALSRLAPPPINLVSVRGGESFYFSLDKGAGQPFREEKIDWSLRRIFDALRGALGASPEVTLAIYAKYLGGELSGHFSRSVARALAAEKGEFFGQIRKMNPKGALYVDSEVPLPADFRPRLGRAAAETAPIGEILEKFGFRLSENWNLGDDETFVKLAPFLEFYFDKSDSEINRRFRRRLHWLIQ